MRIELSGAGKRFNREWIFRNVHLQLRSGTAYAITGSNGSGKSTLLQLIGGMFQPSTGRLTYFTGDAPLPPDQAYRHLSFCAPYLDVVEEMTLTEFLHFHFRFKPSYQGITVPAIIEVISLQAAAGKQIRYFSSGMKQRVKLAQCIFTDSAALLLDEPCSNLDSTGIALYHDLIGRYGTDRLIVVCSNDEVEYRFCTEHIRISDYK
ncbi:MAG TPA: ATP-binding cassette domain-containing protein [Chitinophagaceae bacterium]|jgi:ABC-type multidrug transport system ATPase subunit|nr:ATP-binding cassette domain-containing protein [Chitinophagaceae bacterium]